MFQIKYTQNTKTQIFSNQIYKNKAYKIKNKINGLQFYRNITKKKYIKHHVKREDIKTFNEQKQITQNKIINIDNT